MITPTHYPEDTQFEDVRISRSDRCGEGWDITRSDGWSFYVPPESPIEPHPGQTARFYGRGMGYTVRGLFIDGVKVFYRTEEEDRQHHLVQAYGTDASEWLKRWDDGQTVWSIEMGGLGPGYEQAIQITVAEILRTMLAEKFDGASWSDPEAWKRDREKVEAAGFKSPVIDKLGLSGAQWGAALQVAARLYMHGPIKVLTDEQIEDRKIQVSKSFPQG